MNNSLIKLGHDLKKFCDLFEKEKNRIVSLNNVYKSKFLFFNHFIANESFLNSPYRNLLINYFKKSEKLHPGSGYDTSVKLYEKILGYNNTQKKYKTDKNYENIMLYLKGQTNEYVFNLFENILTFSGSNAVLTCQATKNDIISIEKNEYPKFNIEVCEDFIDVYFNNVNKQTKNVIFSITDAFIERESELMPLIELAKKENLTAVLVCRGISDNAKREIKSILLRNKIKLVPYISKFNDNDPFLFEDLSKIANCKVLTSETYDSLYKNITEKSSIIKVSLEKNGITFYESSESLSSEITKQITENTHNSETLQYLYKRKSRISPNNVIINIPMQQIRLLSEIKNLIKVYNLCAIFGLNNINGTLYSKHKKETTDRLSDSLYMNLNNLGLVVSLNNGDNK